MELTAHPQALPPAPIHPANTLERLRDDVYLEGDEGRGAILHAPRWLIVSFATRLGFQARPHVRPGRALATLHFTPAKVTRIREFLKEAP